jgi:hypothetical protein
MDQSAPVNFAVTQTAAGPMPLSPDRRYVWDGENWIPRGDYAGYRTASGRARVTRALFIVYLLVAVAELVAFVSRIILLNNIESGAAVSYDDAAFSDNFVRLAVYAELGMLVLLAIAFLMWLHRIVANNWSLAVEGTRWSPRAAVGWWFVPIASFVVPARIVIEAWRCAEPVHEISTFASRALQRTPRLVVIWWVSWIIAELLTRSTYFVGRSGDTLTALRQSAIVAVVATAGEMIAAVLAIAVVTQLTRRQEARASLFARVQDHPHLTPPPPPPPPAP